MIAAAAYAAYCKPQASLIYQSQLRVVCRPRRGVALCRSSTGGQFMKCPHCSIAFHARWNEWFVEADDSARYKAEHEEASNRNFSVDSTQCPECQKLIFRLSTFPSLPEPVPIPPEDSFIVYPHGVAPRPVPTEVGKEFGDDFDEACRVLPISQKASAALSRRCLQNLLREKAKVKPSTLAREIQEAIKTNSFPGNLEKSLDAVRSVGNFAAHPINPSLTQERAIGGILPPFWPKITCKLLILGRRA